MTSRALIVTLLFAFVTAACGRTPAPPAVSLHDAIVMRDADAEPAAMNQAGYSPVCGLAFGEQTRRRSLAEVTAVIALFRDAGSTDETVIDERRGTLSMLEDWLRKQDR